MATDFVDILDNPSTRTRTILKAGDVSKPFPTEQYFGMLFQVKGNGPIEVVLEGVTAPGVSKSQDEEKWTRITSYTKEGIYECAPLPALTRLRVISGEITLAQAEMMRQPNQFQTGLVSEMRMINENLAGAKAVQIFQNLGNANEIVEDVKRKTSSMLTETRQSIDELADIKRDIAQSRELNNAATAQLLGRKTAPSVAEIGAEAGLWNIISGSEAGQVWERLADGSVERRPGLEAAPAAADAARRNLALSELRTRTREDGPQFVDGHRWLWRLTGQDNNGTIVASADSGYWWREYSGAVDIRWFGAVGDGKHDDAPAIQAADNSLGENGGEVFFPTPPVAWLLGSNATGLVEQAGGDYLYSCLYPNHNRVYRGTGWKCRIKVKSGLGNLPDFAGRIGPMGWARQSVLYDTRWQDIWYEGSGDLLTADTNPVPSMAMVMLLNGGVRVRTDRVQITNITGSQCIFAPATAPGPEGITVSGCRFWNNGEGVAGNYNHDHSSVYLNGDNNVVEDCDFGCDVGRVVRGAAWEIHGSNYRARNNNVWRYQMTFWVAPNYGKLDAVVVENIQAYEVTYAWGFGTDYSLGHVSIRNSTFRQSPDKRVADDQPYPFFASAPQQLCDVFELDNVVLEGVPWRASVRGLQLNYTRHLKISGGKITGFPSGAMAHAGTELYGVGTGLIAEQIEIDGVTIANNGGPDEADLMIFGGGIGKLRLQNNTFSGSNNRIPWLIDSYVGEGQISGNTIPANYAKPRNLNSPGVLAEVYGAGVPTIADQNVAPGSRWINRTNGDIYIRRADGWHKAVVVTPQAAPVGATGETAVLVDILKASGILT